MAFIGVYSDRQPERVNADAKRLSQISASFRTLKMPPVVDDQLVQFQMLANMMMYLSFGLRVANGIKRLDRVSGRAPLEILLDFG